MDTRATHPARLVVAALVLPLAACGGSIDVPTGSAAEAEPLVADETPIWVTGRTLHLGRETVDLPAEPRIVQRAGDALFYVDQGGTLHRWAGEDEELGDVDADQLVVSADGRYLGFVDFAGGSRGLMGRVAAATVLDLGTGDQVVRADDGMGGRTDDLTDLYEDAPPGVIGFDDGAVYVQTAESNDVYRYDLSTGDGESLGDRGEVSLPDALDGELSRSPGGTYVASDQRGIPRIRRVDGERAAPTRGVPEQILLGGWLDDDTWYAYGYSRGRLDSGQVVTCEVGDACVEWGEVTPFPERGPALWPNGAVSFE